MAALPSASGSPDPADNDVTLRCAGLPVGSVGYFLAARDPGFTPQPGGSAGDLCLGGPIGRYSQSVLTAGPSGAVALAIDVTRIPHPTQPFAVVAGDTVRFQYWYRDITPAGATSNLSGGLAVHFCPGQLFSQEQLATGQAAFDLASGDFDNDGDIDFAVTEQVANTVSVRLGDGHGTFADDVSYALTLFPRGVVARDFDVDGNLDLAVVSRPGVVSLLGGRGDGTFTAPVTHAVESNAWSIVAGDLDGDGDLDLATSGAAGFSMLLNVGNGTFAPYVYVPVTGLRNRLALGDLDGDSDLDMVVASDVGFTTVENLGGANFVATNSYALPTSSRSLALADLDGDGDLDLATAEYESGNIELFEYHLSAFLARGTLTRVVENPGAIEAVDLDGDGRLDLAVGGNDLSPGADGLLRVCRNLGQWTFGAPRLFGRAGWIPFALDSTDLDGDGALDFLVACNGGNVVSVLVNDGAGHVVPDLEVRLPSVLNHPLTGDVDNDGDVDVVALGQSPPVLVALRNSGTGGFAPQPAVPLTALVDDGELDDLDGDGDLDLICWRAYEAEVFVFTNQGNGTFVPSASLPLGPVPMDLELGDLDADGDLDAVVVTGGGLLTPIPGEVVVLTNAGNGSFGIAQRIAVGGEPASVALVDIDADGDLDALSTNRMANQLRLDILSNDGVGGFAVSSSAALPGAPFEYELVPGDVEGDGDTDLLLAIYDTSTNYILENRGNNTVTVSQPIGSAQFQVRRTLLVDIEGDSDLDIVLNGDSAVWVQRNAGDGTFDEGVQYHARAGLFDLAVADLDGDADGDLLMVHTLTSSGLLTIRRGNCR